MKNKIKGIPHLGPGTHIGHFPPDLASIKGKSKHKCLYYNAETKTCSALKHIKCVGTTHVMCKYVEDKDKILPLETIIPSGIVNNGTTVTLKEMRTGEEISISVDSHTHQEHKILLGKKLFGSVFSEDSIVEWEGRPYLIWKIE